MACSIFSPTTITTPPARPAAAPVPAACRMPLNRDDMLIPPLRSVFSVYLEISSALGSGWRVRYGFGSGG
ncbi:hypothetical protein ACFFX0_31525 [Citricoccus parietis]|uniref:Uncharacterized protein n=1 Tax=Citricoccus parietis TaxID=592307 RepID=A0ABV5G939_9MICC